MFAPFPFAFGAQILAVSSQTFQTLNPLTLRDSSAPSSLSFLLAGQGTQFRSQLPRPRTRLLGTFQIACCEHGWSQNFGRTHFAETQVHILGTPAPSTASAAANDAYRPAASYSRLVQEANP